AEAPWGRVVTISAALEALECAAQQGLHQQRSGGGGSGSSARGVLQRCIDAYRNFPAVRRALQQRGSSSSSITVTAYDFSDAVRRGGVIMSQADVLQTWRLLC
ncbi:unnamed protein product, partial [Chrysoparadoxa australica]